jgi:hypothetical protein
VTETVEYGFCFAAAALLCIAEGMFLLACFFGGLAIRAIWHKLLLALPGEKQNAHR